ncbi:hypothetical protein C8J57DRAFT_1229889 [Mycena rebaudengoi]|nr:hypothetical protein C8J57DRAFT_1229889 [Mycena rebaudengoi]
MSSDMQENTAAPRLGHLDGPQKKPPNYERMRKGAGRQLVPRGRSTATLLQECGQRWRYAHRALLRIREPQHVQGEKAMGRDEDGRPPRQARIIFTSNKDDDANAHKKRCYHKVPPLLPGQRKALNNIHSHSTKTVARYQFSRNVMACATSLVFARTPDPAVVTVRQNGASHMQRNDLILISKVQVGAMVNGVQEGKNKGNQHTQGDWEQGRNWVQQLRRERKLLRTGRNTGDDNERITGCNERHRTICIDMRSGSTGAISAKEGGIGTENAIDCVGCDKLHSMVHVSEHKENGVKISRIGANDSTR